MKHRVCRLPAYLSIVFFSMLWASSAWAIAHTYDVYEIFSNSDGTIQFVELLENNQPFPANGQNVFLNAALVSDSTIFVFPNNLPSAFTARTNVLIATAGFAALPGAPAPDYIMPNGFVNVNGDTIQFCANPSCAGISFYDSLSFASLPTDGITSLNRADVLDPLIRVTAVNSPTNFAGESGSVDVSAPSVPGLSEAGVALLIMSLMIVGARIIRASKFQRG